MSRPNWRDPANYEALRFADVATLASEFLRRNPDYLADRGRLAKLAAEHALTTAERDAFALAWGVRFRCGRRSSVVDTTGAPNRERRNGDAADAGRDVAPR